MYSLNPLKRNVLITAEEVMFHAPTKHTLDARMIESSIIIAEERFIVPELGYDLYTAIAAQKNVLVTAGNKATLQGVVGATPVLQEGDLVNAYEQLATVPYKDLWLQHLWKLISECVLAAAYPEGFVQFGSEGALHNNPPAGLMVTSGFVTPLLSSMKWAVDKKVKDRIAPLIQSMHNYLCRNKTLYTAYDSSKCPACDGDDRMAKYNGIALDIYDDEDSPNCCGGGFILRED